MDNSKVVIGKQQPIDACRQVDPLTRGTVLGDDCGLAAKARTRPALEPEHAIVSDNSLLRMLKVPVAIKQLLKTSASISIELS